MGSIVRYHPNERVDLGDLEAMQTVIVDEHQRWSNALFATGVNRILDGFTRSGAAASMTITLGKAIVAEVRGAATKFGQLLTEGLASQNVDFTGKPVATHGVWIRFVYADGEKANRFFWDDTVDEERVRLVNTRQVAGWNVTISTASPGAEWLQLYSVAWDGSRSQHRQSPTSDDSSSRGPPTPRPRSPPRGARATIATRTAPRTA